MTLDIKLDKYTLLEEIGRGGYGTVYRAMDDSLQIERAVKILHPTLVADPTFIERFREEARLVARLKHPNIAPVYDLGEDQGRIFLAMEYFSGGSLKDVLSKGGPIPFDEALEILQQVASALDYAHKQDLVHRDVKPGNLLFDDKGNAYLTDFGFAKSLASADGSTTMSLTGGILGTPAYMAPEAWDGEGWTPSADVYSLACVFFEMLMGVPLFDGGSPTRLMMQHIIVGPQFPKKWPESVPSGMEKILYLAFVKDPKNRYSDPNEFVESCSSQLLDVSKVPLVKSKEFIPDFSKWQQRWLWVGTIGVIALVLGIVFGKTLLESEVGYERDVKIISDVTTKISPKDGMVQIYIPAGKFMMGGDAPEGLATCSELRDNSLGGECKIDWFKDEEPAHSLYLDAFWIDQHEVTNVQFSEFLNQEGNQTEEGFTRLEVEYDAVRIEKVGAGHWQSLGDYGNHPVVHVTWYGVRDYCEWAGRRLPTEAEWEKAARGGLEGKKFPWGDENPVCTAGSANGAEFAMCDKWTAPVMTYSANGYNLYDMAGNVLEWVADLYDVYAGGDPNADDSFGEGLLVLRGGAWYLDGYSLRVAKRDAASPDSTGYGIGFRCAMNADQ